LYGNLKQSGVTVGDRIAAGQTIAGVGESEDEAARAISISSSPRQSPRGSAEVAALSGKHDQKENRVSHLLRGWC
jgi:hypothetical protein